MLKKFLDYLRKNQKGVSMIETAIVLPIILSIVWGSFQSGFYLYTKTKLQSAKRIGLKEMEINGGLNATVIDAIKKEFADTSIDISTLQISGTPAPQQYGTQLTLNLKLNYGFSVLKPFTNSGTWFSHTLEVEDFITSEYIIR